MNVLKSDCGGITGAGEYKFRDGHLIVTLYQIAIWSEHPAAIFTAVRSIMGEAIKLYVLASWRLPSDQKSGDHQVDDHHGEDHHGFEAPTAVSAAGTSLR